MPAGAWGPKCRKGEEGCKEPSGGQIVRAEGAGDPHVCQASSVSALCNNGGEASLPRQDRVWGGEQGIRGPPLNPVPTAVHAPEAAGVGGVEVGCVS